jgi:hypothetical protein
MTRSTSVEFMKKPKIFGIELPPEAQAAYDHANAVPAGRFERKRSSAKVVASAATPTASTTPVQPVVERRKVEPSGKTEAFAQLSVREQARELRRIIGLRRLSLDDDRVAEISRKAVEPYGRR